MLSGEGGGTFKVDNVRYGLTHIDIDTHTDTLFQERGMGGAQRKEKEDNRETKTN